MTQTEDQTTDTLEPFEESFPSSHKIHERVEWNGHVLHVPKRRIHLSNDDDPVDAMGHGAMGVASKDHVNELLWEAPDELKDGALLVA